jgi:hypothetical protein
MSELLYHKNSGEWSFCDFSTQASKLQQVAASISLEAYQASAEIDHRTAVKVADRAA